MKMIHEHYAELTRQLDAALVAHGISYPELEATVTFNTDRVKAALWQLYHLACRLDNHQLQRRLYQYLNDDHIYSALKAWRTATLSGKPSSKVKPESKGTRLVSIKAIALDRDKQPTVMTLTGTVMNLTANGQTIRCLYHGGTLTHYASGLALCREHEIKAAKLALMAGDGRRHSPREGAQTALNLKLARVSPERFAQRIANAPILND